MSYASTVRTGWYASALTALGVITLTSSLFGAPRQSDSPHGNTLAKSSEHTANNTSTPVSGSTTTKKVVLRSPIAYPTLRKPASQLRSGTSRTVRSGVNGEKEVVYRVYLNSDGTELRREVASSRILKAPQAEVVEEGRTAQLPSRGYFSGRRVVTMSATWYDPYHDGSPDHGRTYTGVLGGYGVVAVDPSFIPLGTRLFIEGYGYAVAGDIGGAIKGNRIDLAIDSQHDVKNIKDMSHVRVHILD